MLPKKPMAGHGALLPEPGPDQERQQGADLAKLLAMAAICALRPFPGGGFE